MESSTLAEIFVLMFINLMNFFYLHRNHKTYGNPFDHMTCVSQ